MAGQDPRRSYFYGADDPGNDQEQVKDIQNTIRVTLERMDGGDK